MQRTAIAVDPLLGVSDYYERRLYGIARWPAVEFRAEDGDVHCCEVHGIMSDRIWRLLCEFMDQAYRAHKGLPF